jgi:iron complex transport system ATP-binding protein
VLRCDQLALAVPGRVLARGVDFEARAGEIWAVLGANGSGKTTLLHTLAGLAAPAGGTVVLEGVPPARYPAAERARRVGLLLQQEDGVFWGSVLEYVLLGRFPHTAGWYGWSREDEAAARAALAALGLDGLATRGYATLSGGERQRARIAQLLAQDPQLLLLDEPLQHLDLRHQVAVLRLARALARERGRVVIAVFHDALWPARACTHALVIGTDGTVEQGPARELLTRERLERVYGCRLRELDGEERFFVPIL